MAVDFMWDEGNTKHVARHLVEPLEAEEVFLGDYFDLESEMVGEEERFSVIGETKRGRILILWMTWRHERLRVITAWDAPKATKLRYVQAKGLGDEF